MKRRQFVAASLLAGLTPAAFPASSRAAEKPAKELYELRFFKLASPEKAAVMEDFFQQAAIPVWNRLGIGPVGVFKMLDGKDPGLYVLLPHKSLESVVTLSAKMAADRAFLQAGAAVFDAPPKDPAYLRMQSSLLLAFDGMPKLEVPTTKDTRILQLRIYESPGLRMARRKLEMFNTAGEMAIFRRAGMTAVFFGEAIISDRMPHLVQGRSGVAEAQGPAGVPGHGFQHHQHPAPPRQGLADLSGRPTGPFFRPDPATPS
jgi:hypothetical protein